MARRWKSLDRVDGDNNFSITPGKVVRTGWDLYDHFELDGFDLW